MLGIVMLGIVMLEIVMLGIVMLDHSNDANYFDDDTLYI